MANVPFSRGIRLPHSAYADAESSFHIVIRARVDSAPFRGSVATSTWNILEREHERGRVQITAACLMPDHLHVVVSPLTHSVIKWVNSFKSFTTTRSWKAGWNGVLWQPSFFDRRLRDEAEYWGAINYIRENPAAAGLDTPWPWMHLPPEAR